MGGVFCYFFGLGEFIPLMWWFSFGLRVIPLVSCVGVCPLVCCSTKS